MFVIMGANGHVGSAVANVLLSRGQPVTVVTHDEGHVGDWRDKGAEIAVADVNDPDSLRRAFKLGDRAFLLNPPADVQLDTDAIERASVAGILAALDGSGLEKVVVESVSAAQPGHRIGDLSVLWELQDGAQRQTIPAAINGAPIYMSNWDVQLEQVRETGKLSSMTPADLKLPMAAPKDLGRIAADRLMSGLDDIGVRPIEGPDRYSPADVAEAFSKALGRSVTVEVTPPEKLESAFRALGFSQAAAKSYARMTRTTIDQIGDAPADAIRGTMTIDDYIGELVARA